MELFARGANSAEGFLFGAGLYVSGIARLRGSRACSADGQQDCRCAVRRVGDVGAVSRALWLAAEAASHRTCAVRLRPHRRLSLSPLNNIVFAPPQKHLMRLARIKRACYVRTRAAHVRRPARRRAMRAWNRSGSRRMPHRVRRALCALDHTGVYLFPLNNSVFAPPQKLLMHLECIKRAYNVRTRAAHVRCRIDGGFFV